MEMVSGVGEVGEEFLELVTKCLRTRVSSCEMSRADVIVYLSEENGKGETVLKVSRESESAERQMGYFAELFSAL